MTPDLNKTDPAAQRGYNAAAYFIALLFFVFNLTTLGSKSLWIDEMRTGYGLMAHSVPEFFRYIVLNDPVSPLYSISVAVFCKIFGNSDFAMRLPSLLLGTACIPAFFSLSRRLIGNNMSLVSQNFMDTIAVKENVFSGMYGDVVVGFSDAYVLTNEFSIFVFDGAPPAKTKYEISHPVVMINNSEIHGGRSFPIFMHEKDFYTISSLDAYSAATGEGIGRFDEIKFVRGKSAVKLRNYPRQAVFLKKGRFDLTLPENIKGITIEKLNPVKMVDEGIGPEMRGYFLNWIKK